MKKIERHSSGRVLSGAMLWIFAWLVASSDLRAGDACAPILQAAEIARHDFALRLEKFPAKTDFDRFVEDIDNYDVGLSDAGDTFVVVLKLRKRERGEVIKGGGAVYKVRKKDLAIISFVGQE